MQDKILAALLSLKSDRRGVTAVEYALMGTLIAAAVVTAASGLGTKLTALLNSIGTSI